MLAAQQQKNVSGGKKAPKASLNKPTMDQIVQHPLTTLASKHWTPVSDFDLFLHSHF